MARHGSKASDSPELMPFDARSTARAMGQACSPERRTMPMPPRPAGVAMAAMVSSVE